MYSGFCAYNSSEHAVYLPKHEGLKEPEMEEESFQGGPNERNFQKAEKYLSFAQIYLNNYCSTMQGKGTIYIAWDMRFRGLMSLATT